MGWAYGCKKGRFPRKSHQIHVVVYIRGDTQQPRTEDDKGVGKPTKLWHSINVGRVLARLVCCLQKHIKRYRNQQFHDINLDDL